MKSSDIIIAIIIAIVIVLIYFFVWPGLYLVNSNQIAGYWSDRIGQIYKIIPINKKKFQITFNDKKFQGNISNIRKINIENSKGNIQYGNRFIEWSNGNLWTKQAY